MCKFWALASYQGSLPSWQKHETKTARRMVATAGGIVRKEAKALALSQGLKQTGSLIKNIAIKREKMYRKALSNIISVCVTVVSCVGLKG